MTALSQDDLRLQGEHQCDEEQTYADEQTKIVPPIVSEYQNFNFDPMKVLIF